MATCARCKADVAPSDTYFSDGGEVCGPCHATLEAEASTTFKAGANGNAVMASMSNPTVYETVTVKDDGSVHTMRFTGILGLLMNLWRWFRSRSGPTA